MTPTGRLPENGPDELSGRLARALKEGLPQDPVDVPRMLAATRPTVRRARTQRRLVVAVAAVAALLVPVGWSVGMGLGRTSSPAAPGLSRPTPVPVPDTRDPSPARTPSAGPTARTAGRSGLRPIPDSVALTDADFGQPLIKTVDQTQKEDPAYGSCSATEVTKGQVIGRGWWWKDNPENPSLDIMLVVTQWEPTWSRSAFALERPGSGRCRQTSASPAPTTGLPGDEVWAVTGPATGGRVPRATVASRVGDAIISISVQDAAGEQSALGRAQRLLSIVVGRVEAVGLGGAS